MCQIIDCLYLQTNFQAQGVESVCNPDPPWSAGTDHVGFCERGTLLMLRGVRISVRAAASGCSVWGRVQPWLLIKLLFPAGSHLCAPGLLLSEGVAIHLGMSVHDKCIRKGFLSSHCWELQTQLCCFLTLCS